MTRPFTIQNIKNSACARLNEHLFEKPKVKREKYSKEKYWINFRLEEYAREQGLELKTEHRFDEVRKWRFDWAIPELMIAFEYEGIFSKKSRHTTAKGFTGDAEKYNRAQKLEWKVYRYTAINYNDLSIDLITIKK